MADRYMTIPTLVKARFRKAHGPEAPLRCPTFRNAGTAGSVREEMLAQARLPEALMSFLLEMDRKLDTILGYLQGESLTEDFPLEGRVSSLSVETLVLETKESLRGGEHVELLLFLEEFPLNLIAVIAEITEILQGEAAAERPNASYAVRYTCMDEGHRESIIRFIFQEERRRIRLQKSIGEALD